MIDRCIIRLVYLYFMVFMCGPGLLYCQDALNDRLAAIERGVKGETNVEQAEGLMIALLREYPALAQQGTIYVHLVTMFDRHASAMRPTKVSTYARRALEYPLDLLEKARMYLLLGSAISAQYARSNASEHLVHRREIVTYFLQGVKVLDDAGITYEEVVLSGIGVGAVDIDPDDPLYKQAMAQLQQARLAAQEARMKVDLAAMRRNLLNQIAGLYAIGKDDSLELESVAKEILNSDDEARALVARARSRRRW